MAVDRSFPKQKYLPKKKRERSLKSIEFEVWTLCKAVTRVLYKDCYTCFQKNLVGMNCQTGHMHPKGACGASMKYDLRLLRLQCFQCNINHGGMGAVFLENMKREIGEQKALALLREAQSSKGKPIKARDYYLLLIPLLKQQLDELKFNHKGYDH